MSSRARLLALCGLAALLALVAGFTLLSRGQSNSSAATGIRPLHPISTRRRLNNQRPLPRMLRKGPARTSKHTTKALVKPSHASGLRAATKPQTLLDGLPRALSLALDGHDVVVVALVSPRASVDQMAKGEAQAGAALAGAGFLAVSTANESAVSALTTLVDSSHDPTNRLLDSPAVLVFQRQGKLFVRLNGFADRQTVEQAAANAQNLG